MKFELTKENVQLLLEIFTQVDARGTFNMRKVVALEDKIIKTAKKNIAKKTKIKNNDNKREGKEER